MPKPAPSGPPQFTVTTVVNAPAARVLRAFFTHADLAYWWGVERSVTVPRPSAPFAVTWAATDERDDLLGQFGGTLHGTVVDYMDDRALLVAEVYWQPPTGEPLGPMAIEVRCTPEGDGSRSRVSVRQSASDTGPRWDRYFAIAKDGWEQSLDTLRDYLENEWLYRVRTIKQALQ